MWLGSASTIVSIVLPATRWSRATGKRVHVSCPRFASAARARIFCAFKIFRREFFAACGRGVGPRSDSYSIASARGGGVHSEYNDG